MSWLILNVSREQLNFVLVPWPVAFFVLRADLLIVAETWRPPSFWFIHYPESPSFLEFFKLFIKSSWIFFQSASISLMTWPISCLSVSTYLDRWGKIYLLKKMHWFKPLSQKTLSPPFRYPGNKVQTINLPLRPCRVLTCKSAPPLQYHFCIQVTNP